MNVIKFEDPNAKKPSVPGLTHVYYVVCRYFFDNKKEAGYYAAEVHKNGPIQSAEDINRIRSLIGKDVPDSNKCIIFFALLRTFTFQG